MSWSRLKEESEGHVGTFTRLISFMEKEVKVRESASYNDVEVCGVKDVKSPLVKNARHVPRLATASALPAVSRKAEEARKCVFCEDEHFARFCSKPMDVRERWRLVRASGACFRCGVRGHHKARCLLKVVCDKCGGLHISPLCERDVLRKVCCPVDKSVKSNRAEKKFVNESLEEVSKQNELVKTV